MTNEGAGYYDRMKRLNTTAIILALFPASLFADFTVEFKTGEASVISAGKKIPLAIGSSLMETDTIELSAKSLIVLRESNTQVRLRGPAKKTVAALRTETAKSPASSLVNKNRTPVQAAGVRAKTAMPSKNTVKPVQEDKNNEKKEDAKKDYELLLAGKKYDDVIRDLSKPQNAQEILWLGMAWYGKENYVQTANVLSLPKIQGTQQEHQAIVLEADSLLRMNQFEKAQQRLNAFISEKDSGIFSAEILFYLNHAAYFNNLDEDAARWKNLFKQKFPSHELESSLY